MTGDKRLSRKWLSLIALSLATMLGMAVWFSASAVIPALTRAWNLGDGGRAWLTISVQIGFVAGALGSALLNLSDRVSARWLFVASSILAAGATALIPLAARGPGFALAMRIITGLALAGVYPVGMKIMATWTREDRGLGIGLLVGALTVGSAGPHLINFFGGVGDAWQMVLYSAAGSASLGGLLAALFVREGPYRTETPPFNWRYVLAMTREKGTVLANLGYLGHMWELYAVWSWGPIFLLASFGERGIDSRWASLAGFGLIAVGGLGSFLAGLLADRFGRTGVSIGSLLISGAISLGIGRFYGENPVFLTGLALLWGFAVVADSAQFSASVSELADPRYTGTALTIQTSLGFLLTVITIRLIPTLEGIVGWRWAFAFLALGPLMGIAAMWSLKRSPEAVKLAGGRG
jgi:MFS family permease